MEAADGAGRVLTPKNMHALRTLFNIAHKLHPVLGSSWILVLENLNSLDRILNSPRTTTQVNRLRSGADHIPGRHPYCSAVASLQGRLEQASSNTRPLAAIRGRADHTMLQDRLAR